jgi:preprotein translocase subunit SecF
MFLPLRLVPLKTNFRFVEYRKLSFAFSILVSLLTIIMLVTKGLNFGIDFSGGLMLEIRTQDEVGVEQIREVLQKSDYSSATIQSLGSERDFMVRVQPRTEDSKDVLVENLQAILSDNLAGGVEFRKVDYVGPKVGRELIVSGMQALFVAVLGMLVYIWFRFDLHFGIGAVISTAHDALIALGFFVFTGYDFDLSSIAAILTIIGYSINDTVVIYDRIRENLRKYPRHNLSTILNLSINETFSRTVMTLLTTVVVCIALVTLGGEGLRGFSMALLFGIIFGTESSLYIAAPLLLHTRLAK